MTYIIVKAYGENNNKLITIWNVTDSTGYVYDTFSRKCDAQHWINSNK